ncbi:hypothetical protein AB0H34_43800, partial [Saccharopolyspora shandongensis]|uniref:hypothetical protein n=1 Tax=Saccharopolyspora shandongensis TaxID=418495 RepID=UPI0033FB3016
IATPDGPGATNAGAMDRRSATLGGLQGLPGTVLRRPATPRTPTGMSREGRAWSPGKAVLLPRTRRLVLESEFGTWTRELDRWDIEQTVLAMRPSGARIAFK